MQIFTSLTANYLPKARVLAATVKRWHPNARFTLVLADRRPEPGHRGLECFDAIWTLDDLPIPDQRRWTYQHNLVEMCTAVKGVAARRLVREHRQPVLFLDPDIAVFAPLDDLVRRLDQNSVLLTPHITRPMPLDQPRPREILFLMFGIYNLGFFGFAGTDASRQVLDWFAERLLLYCRMDNDWGLFADQRWMDIAPSCFPEIGIVRDPQYNVGPWNLCERTVEGIAPDSLAVNGNPLAFYHFSGLERGEHESAIRMHAADPKPLLNLCAWYREACRQNTWPEDSKHPWLYAAYDDGTPITDHERWLYRRHPNLQAEFPDPRVTEPYSKSFLAWCRAHPTTWSKLSQAVAWVTDLQKSRTFRFAQGVANLHRTTASPLKGLRRWLAGGKSRTPTPS